MRRRGGFVTGFVQGFVGGLGAELFDALEILHGTAVKTLGLGLVAKEEGPGVGIAGALGEAFGEAEIAIVGAGDFEIAGEHLVGEDLGHAFGTDGFVEAGGEEAVFEGGGAEEGELRQGDAFQGEEFLGVDGLVAGDEVGAEVDEDVGWFEADDGVVFGGEGMFAGILGGAGFALGVRGPVERAALVRLAARRLGEVVFGTPQG